MILHILTEWNSYFCHEKKIGIYSSKKNADKKLKELEELKKKRPHPHQISYQIDEFELNISVA